ncbi:MAG TPA: hypothetical protein VMV92_32365 [Streptosporangiaceae bacterium]|nr:hypothetical protein [Streptosporangiaceae bacterium]
MTSDTAPPLGLYSIGIRDLDVTALLTLAAGHQVPFLHLRGGPKGYDLARRDRAQLAAWARQARDGVPVTMVTADLDLADFLQPAALEYRRACAELERLAEATRALGASAVRLLARRPPLGTDWDALVIPDLPAGHGLATLIEIHHPAWFTPHALAVLRDLLDRASAASVLLDSAQFHAAIVGRADVLPATCLTALIERTLVAHLSDTGAGLTGTGHPLLARAVRAAAGDGQPVEVAFEWTGADRSPEGCLTRYRAARAWWQQTGTSSP